MAMHVAERAAAGFPEAGVPGSFPLLLRTSEEMGRAGR